MKMENVHVSEPAKTDILETADTLKEIEAASMEKAALTFTWKSMH